MRGFLSELLKIHILGLAHDEIAPVVALEENLKVLELFHGPTLAFKDFALQLLGNLYEEQIKKSGRESLTILGATSGDTGAAAISLVYWEKRE